MLVRIPDTDASSSLVSGKSRYLRLGEYPASLGLGFCYAREAFLAQRSCAAYRRHKAKSRGFSFPRYLAQRGVLVFPLRVYLEFFCLTIAFANCIKKPYATVAYGFIFYYFCTILLYLLWLGQRLSPRANQALLRAYPSLQNIFCRARVCPRQRL